MAVFYENMIVWHPDVDEVVRALGSVEALVGPAGDRAVVVFHKEDGLSNPAHTIAQPLTETLRCRLLHCAVFEDLVLGCSVWLDGSLLAEHFVPDLGDYLGLGVDELMEIEASMTQADVPIAESSCLDALVEALSMAEADRVRQVLTGDYDSGGDRQIDLLTALDLPAFPAYWGHRYLVQDSGTYQGPELTATG